MRHDIASAAGRNPTESRVEPLALNHSNRPITISYIVTYFQGPVTETVLMGSFQVTTRISFMPVE
jgi:hypothetical protein